MLAQVTTFAIDGVEPRRVTVEANLRERGFGSFVIVGLADKAVREARERVQAALTNVGYVFPSGRMAVNLAPAYLRKAGSGFDLPLAVAILAASGQLAPELVADVAFVGELGMDGSVGPVNGVLALAEGARRCGLSRVVVPRSRGREAALVDGLEIIAVDSLREAVEVLRGVADPPPLPPPRPVERAEPPDLADVRGHNGLIAAIEAAAAGGHNLFMHGPPGTGKTMLAQRLPGLLPPMTDEEALDVTRIYSAVGMHDGSGLITERPFRAPHHQISSSGLVGGGATPMPGEVTYAHHGVLFCDEFSEFNRAALEALRQPLEDGRVTVVRGQRVLSYPCRVMLVAATNPCPCGMGEPRCRCSAADLTRYARRLSGPLIDRMDISIHVPRPNAQQLRDQAAPSSAEVRARVMEARARQAARFAGLGITCNGQMTAAMVRELVGATPAAIRVLHEMHDLHALSARGNARILRVSRTLADLAASDTVHPEHVMAALSHRMAMAQEVVAA